MSTYIIGDIHGCFNELQKLLKIINFNTDKDFLFFTGDLVNGGPNSLDTLRFIKNLKDNSITVLGNHDITLLAVAVNAINFKNDRKIGFEQILESNFLYNILDWIRNIPLSYYIKEFDVLLTHAGLYPNWSIAEACKYSLEVENMLKSNDYIKLLNNIYGSNPIKWKDNLTSWDRYRFIINALTRMRFCNDNFELEFQHKGNIKSAPINYKPWFNIINNKNSNTKIAFGHWASIMGKTNNTLAIALDTGCVWGNYLTAIRLDDFTFFTTNNS